MSLVSKRKTTKKFIIESMIMHNRKYDYSLTNYSTAWSKVKIICPIHGIFEQIPVLHCKGNGCPSCRDDDNGVRHKISAEDLMHAANIKHENYYDYSSTQWNKTRSRIEIICPAHGMFSEQTHKHIHLGNGCPLCRDNGKSNRKVFKVPREMYIRNFSLLASEVHNNYYSYDNIKFSSTTSYRREKINITCPVHGDFLQQPRKHLEGNGCKKCNQSVGWHRNRYKGIPTTLYYIKINNEFYKIGVTLNNVKSRFKYDKCNSIEVIFEKKYDDGELAYDEEQRILKEYKLFAYCGIPLLSNGNTEIFIKNVLNVDL